MDSEIKTCFNSVDSLKNNSHSIALFFNETCKKLSSNFAYHFKEMSKKCWKSHGFGFGEQQASLFVSHALFEVCKGCVIMEQPIQRRKSKKTEASDYKIGNGRMDYWVLFGSSSILLEVKHSTIVINPETGNLSESWLVEKKNREAIEQIRKIDQKIFWKTGNSLWGASFVIVPIYVEIDDPSDAYTAAKLYTEKKNEIVKLLKKNKFNKINVWELNKEMNLPITWTDFDGNPWYSAYPAVFYGATFHKLSNETRG